MNILLIPGSNSLSHVAKCAALEAQLTRRGHTVLIAVTREYTRFLQRLDLAHTILPDIQESDGGGLPSLAWFRSPDRLASCIQSEIALMKRFQPDRVVGVFRFTLRVSTAFLGVPYDSVACGCMMPDCEETLGFGSNEKDSQEATYQSLYLDNFYRFAAKRISVAMGRLGLAAVRDIRQLLDGDRTFLWDYPQFMPLPGIKRRVHVGPLRWNRWPDLSAPPESFADNHRPTALVSLGTRPAGRRVVKKAVRCLLACGYNVLVVCGGHKNLMDIMPREPHVRCWEFAPLGHLIHQADLVVCHGGQMTIFEALQHRMPVLVIPSQPEQAHNGVCLERIGCGRRLAPPLAFKGDPRAFTDAFLQQPDADIIELIQPVSTANEMQDGLKHAQQHLRRYDAPNMIADLMENS
jgi:UDP:flavonoid glycosyltransferase YjiC (YdhE family)